MIVSTGPNLPNSVGGWAIWIVVIVAIIAIVYVMAQVSGIVIPSFVITVGWILLAVVISVAAIRFLLGQT